MNKKNKKSELIHISDILTSALSRYRPAMDTEMTKIWDIWHDAVGKPANMNAMPDSFKDGILIVNVSSSAWIYQLRFREKEMIKNINKQLKKIKIKQMRFKIGKIIG